MKSMSRTESSKRTNWADEFVKVVNREDRNHGFEITSIQGTRSFGDVVKKLLNGMKQKWKSS